MKTITCGAVTGAIRRTGCYGQEAWKEQLAGRVTGRCDSPGGAVLYLPDGSRIAL